MVFKSRSRKGAQGIGTLIIFIALILVAAVAAGVLIQTASSLQSKSLNVGTQSQEKITTDIDVVQVYALNTSDGFINNTIDNITVVARLGSGSSAIKLSDLLIKYDSSDGSQTVVANTTPAAAPTATEYAVNFIINGTNHNDNYLVEGDLVEFTFTSDSLVSESESTTIRLVAKNGAVKPVDITTPAAMVESTTYLFP